MILTQEFKEFIELLNANDVRYLIVDGYAVAAHVHTRYTKDLDLWIEPTPEDAQPNKLASGRPQDLADLDHLK
jgi:hypothetical protein